MLTRRRFLGALAIPAATACATPRRGAAPALPKLAGSATTIAADESYWFPVQQAFTSDRTLMNLNNGGVSPSPAPVQAALSRYLDFANTAPSHNLWNIQEPQREIVRNRLAHMAGVDSEEIAITRNASEGLQICQFGFDLSKGDEVLTTTQDYPRMIWTFKQRERREGIKLVQFPIPVPAEDPDEIVRRFEAKITPRTKLILMCHMINLTGQILPVKAVVAMARKRGIPVIVDGAHAFAHFSFSLADLDCDYYATSLHKWLFAPFGTGMLYVRKNKITKLWPLMSAPESKDDNIRKFEEIGTHPCPNFLSIADALTFSEGIGHKRKEARLIYLRNRWAERLLANKRVRLHTSLKAGFACGIATASIEGVDPIKLGQHLWKKHRIIVCPIVHDEFSGIRVSPSVYTTLPEVDRFAAAIEDVLTMPTGA